MAAKRGFTRERFTAFKVGFGSVAAGGFVVGWVALGQGHSPEPEAVPSAIPSTSATEDATVQATVTRGTSTVTSPRTPVPTPTRARTSRGS